MLGDFTTDPGNIPSISSNTLLLLVNHIAFIDGSLFLICSNNALELSEKYLPSFDPNIYKLFSLGMTLLSIQNNHVHGPKNNHQYIFDKIGLFRKKTFDFLVFLSSKLRLDKVFPHHKF